MKKWMIMLALLGGSLAACQTRENTQTLENSDTSAIYPDAIDDNADTTNTLADTLSGQPIPRP
ncbi:hypothetical protein GCM10027275_37800 [Rhabdobacter roseus]|uniref:Lipoprotein n=1 Tax=Rhabdobacter roseus TaxID=1655419 RepID=A0A840TPU0_9BACT|nr:hypothetical protein [Rhabdobacter roseus]MBB5285811.1 hypothetical protein [Rhabdobacter roseus]